MPEKVELILVHRYVSGQMEVAEKQRFESRMAQDPHLSAVVNETAAIWSAASAYPSPEFDSSKAYRIFQQKSRRSTLKRRMWLSSAAAAVFLVLVIAGIYLFNLSKAEMVNLVADATMEQVLQDGSTIELHEGAYMRIPETFTSGKRVVELVSGDVYFDVAPDASRPFIIENRWAEVEVVGTEFMIAVDLEAQTVLLVVTEGIVKFTPHLSKEVITVSAGTGLTFNANTRMIEPIRTIDENTLSWHSGKLTFVNIPVSKVVADLKNHYNIEIEVTEPQIQACLFTAPLPFQDVPVSVILDALSTAFTMKVKSVGDRSYVLTGGKCK